MSHEVDDHNKDDSSSLSATATSDWLSNLPAETSTELQALAKAQGWVTVKQFGKIIGRSTPTISRWCKLKMINFVQVGGQKRVTAQEIRRYLVFGTLPPKTEAK